VYKVAFHLNALGANVPKSVYTAAYRQLTKMLVKARTEAELTQAELAEAIGWQQTDISKVERGERRIDVIEFLQFAKVLDIDAQEFMRELQGTRLH
jgi:transcriptional regulator with XRE-family HTH domain